MPADLPTAARFNGIARLYGQAAYGRFARAKVCVIGLGGVGSWAAEALARSGVGSLTLIDLDDICLSNTNRQLHALDGNYGRPKVVAMAERLRRINPDLSVAPVEAFVTATTLALLDEPFDAILDAIDHVAAKCALLHHCRQRRYFVVSVGAAGGRIDPTAIQIKDLSRTAHDALLATVRRRLRREHGFPTNPKRSFGIPAVFSTEQPRYPQGDGSTGPRRPGGESALGLDCGGGLGASMCVTAAFGLAAAARVMERLGREEPQGTPGD
ncbi:MAG: ThiF family adenylyltransferase [Candidatus Competibacterales bacterium]